MNRLCAIPQGNSRPAKGLALARLTGAGLLRAAVSRSWMWLPLVLLVSSGCGGDSSAPPPRRDVSSPAGVNLPGTLDAGRGTPSESGYGARASDQGGGGDQNATAAGKSKPDESEAAGDEPKRPKEVAKWKPDDYLSAKKDGDTNLIAAVTLLGQKYPTSEKVATLLVQLLAVEKEETQANEENSLSGRRGEEGSARGRGRPQTEGDRGGYGGDRGGYSDSGYGGYGEGGYGRGASRGNPRDGRGTAQPGQLDTNRLAKMVIAALANNTTSPARKAINELLTGKLETVLERREAVADVIAALASLWKKENEQILYALIAEPQKIIPAAPASGPDDDYEEGGVASRRGGSGRGYANRALGGTGPVTPDWVQSVALQAVEPLATADFRTRLGTSLDDPNVPVEIAEPLEQFLATEDPRNSAAQIVLYKNRKTTPDIRIAIEDRLATSSMMALAYLLDVPADASPGGANRGGRGRSGRFGRSSGYGEDDGYTSRRPGGGIPGAGRRGIPTGRQGIGRPRNLGGRPGLSGRPSLTGRPSLSGQPGGPLGPGAGGPAAALQTPTIDPRTANLQLAKVLWTADFVAALGTSLQASAGGDGQLGGPNPLRLLGTIPIGASRQILHQRLSEEKSDGPEAWSAAGLLGGEVADPAILVLVKDVHHSASKGAKRRSPRAASGRYGSSESSRGGRGGESASDQDVWLDATKQLVVDLCARFGEAKGHESPSVEGDAAQLSTSRPGGIPVRLHKNATIEAEYHMRWPADVAAKLPGVDIAPLELHYVRVSADQHTRLVPAHYRRQVRNMREEMDGSITWLGGFLRDREKGIERSVDIRIDGIEEGGRSAGGGRSASSGPLTIEILTVEIPDMRPRPADAEPAAPEGGATASTAP